MNFEKSGIEIPQPAPVDVYIAPMGDKAALLASEICGKLRDEGFSALTDLCGRSVKAQMKYANKIGAAATCVIGDSEIENGKARLKNMSTGEESEVTLPDGLISAVYEQNIDVALTDLTESVGELDSLFGINKD